MASYYGWDTKDFVGAAPAPTVTTVSAGSWTATVNMSAVADNIVAGNIRRIEVAVRPVLRSADNTIALALNAPSKTVDLTTNAFVTYYPAIVKVPTGCNNCHDALATTFHSPDRGGNIVVCRMCHVKTSGGSHLEMESRSMDSYAHAIHSFQAFDIQNVHFDNAVQNMFYNLHTESHYPTFGINDCESCHNAGTYNVPNQAKSLPGVMSASRYPLIGKTRAIGTVPSYIGGPASVACGGCHRAELIVEDDEAGLMAFNSHTRTNGYLLENANILTVMWQVMSNFEETVVLPSP
jgi:OmcA/MtrC family decaheme c-type cytochrome